MAQRLIEVLVPEELLGDVEEVISGDELPSYREVWSQKGDDGRTSVQILLEVEHVEPVLDALSRQFDTTEGFRAVVTEVQASIPVPEPSESEKEQEEANEATTSSGIFGLARISREELYTDIGDVTVLDARFIILIIIATITAAIGLLQDNVAIVVGSMVLAPLLGPIVAQALATTLADRDLALTAIKSNAVGFGIAALLSVAIGFIVNLDPNQVLATEQMLLRSKPTLLDVGVGLAVGAAGPLAFTTAAPTALVGVMVAAALLPPTVAFGMFLGGGQAGLAVGSLTLLFVYFISANLSGVIVFAMQGIRPAMWWEEAEARKSTRFAVVAWAIILASLGALIWWFF